MKTGAFKGQQGIRSVYGGNAQTERDAVLGRFQRGRIGIVIESQGAFKGLNRNPGYHV
jgi:superfamily II DNA/RNA helicase